MVKLKQLLLSLIVLTSMAIIEADLQRNALRTEWKAWKQLHGKINNTNDYLHFLQNLYFVFRKELRFKEGREKPLESLHEELNLHQKSQCRRFQWQTQLLPQDEPVWRHGKDTYRIYSITKIVGIVGIFFREKNL